MRIIYQVPFKEPVKIDDHWPISILGGRLTILSEEGRATGIQIAFENQSPSLAPKIHPLDEGKVKAAITGRDTLVTDVKNHLDKASSYLRCYHDITILTDEIKTEFIGENEEEKRNLDITQLDFGKRDFEVPISYGDITRALMAAEVGEAPQFEATLLGNARDAHKQEQFINSFRYSFLLMDAIYGDGKFKAVQLQNAFSGSPEFVALVEKSMKSYIRAKHDHNSPTDQLLATNPTANQVIEHLVERRGFYFHGNLKRKNRWLSHEQKSAETLCVLALDIAMEISFAASASVFSEELSERHLQAAKSSGAIMTFKIQFEYRKHDTDFDQSNDVNFKLPGTKLTPKMSRYAATQFLQQFEFNQPLDALKSATCRVEATNQSVFELKFYDPSQSETE